MAFRIRHRGRVACLCALAIVGCAGDAKDLSDAATFSPQAGQGGTTSPESDAAITGPIAGGGAGSNAADSGTTPSDAGTADAGPPLPPCDDSETAAVQAALDTSHDATNTDVVLTIKSPCGIRYFTSGPSQYPASTLQRIASITKTYVASLALELHDEGLLSLSDPISNWFDNVPGGDKIHVEHLLYHTSALAPTEDSLTFQAGAAQKRVWTPQEIIDISFSLAPRLREPGASMEYVNVNFTILGVILEKVSGKPLATLLRERIFQEIGVSATFSDGDEPFVGTLAVGKSRSGNDISYQLDPSTFWGAGHLVATTDDTAIWLEARATGFHAPSLDDELAKQYEWPGRAGWHYGPGTIILDASVTYGGGPGYGHGGDLPGYHSMAFYFPEKEVTVVIVNDADGLTSIDMRQPFNDTLQALFAGQ